MSDQGFTRQHRAIGRAAAWGIFFIGVLYAVTLALGFLSLKSPQDPIGDPYLSILELLIVLMAPLLLASMVTVHAYAPPEAKAYSLVALVFMIVLASITSSVHFAILTVSRQIEAAGLTWAPLLFSFKWPSVAYTLDILAWDWFYALSVMFAAPVFNVGRLEKTTRFLLIVSGVLSLVGLIGPLLADMQVSNWFVYRNIGIIGYAVVAPVAFLLLAIVFGRVKPMPR